MVELSFSLEVCLITTRLFTCYRDWSVWHLVVMEESSSRLTQTVATSSGRLTNPTFQRNLPQHLMVMSAA